MGKALFLNISGGYFLRFDTGGLADRRIPVALSSDADRRSSVPSVSAENHSRSPFRNAALSR
jgi:hypothetical protein